MKHSTAAMQEYQCHEQDEDVDQVAEAHKTLWASVFMQGIRDYVRPPSPSSIADDEDKMLIRMTETWVWSDRASTGSFLWLCDLFSLSPERVRSALFDRRFGPAI